MTGFYDVQVRLDQKPARWRRAARQIRSLEVSLAALRQCSRPDNLTGEKP